MTDSKTEKNQKYGISAPPWVKDLMPKVAALTNRKIGAAYAMACAEWIVKQAGSNEAIQIIVRQVAQDNPEVRDAMENISSLGPSTIDNQLLNKILAANDATAKSIKSLIREWETKHPARVTAENAQPETGKERDSNQRRKAVGNRK